MPLPLIALAAAGFIKGGGLQGLIGGGKRRAEEKRAQQAQRNAQNAYNNFDFQGNPLSNPFGNVQNNADGLQNQYAGLQVGLQGAQNQRQNNDQSFANILDSQVQAGGGAAGNATALAREAARANQQIAGGIQQQELANQQAQAQGAANIDAQKVAGANRAELLRGQGEQYVTNIREQRENTKLGRLETNLGRADKDLAGAQAARAKATSNLYGGIAGAASGIIGGVGGGAGSAGGGGVAGLSGQYTAPGSTLGVTGYGNPGQDFLNNNPIGSVPRIGNSFNFLGN